MKDVIRETDRERMRERERERECYVLTLWDRIECGVM